ncbi:hypothetical protein [Nocardiopsis tropica]|uniref:DUF4129 domain-containing protein n=1 Tax=Nocardiopsis tropica TaxID=109330 RepID=A0ABU7KR99_9ACTN|nr:hypothetical protein [Nocardiopsis umidischolae]MEE2051828.1 hypothetical protein [Nocardiopsis umidischolae]
MLTVALTQYLAPVLVGGALSAAAAWRLNRKIAARPSPGFAPAMAETDLRRRGYQGEECAAEAAHVLRALITARLTPERPVSAQEVRAGLDDPEPARARLGAHGTPDAYDHARILTAYVRHSARDRIAALVEQALTAAAETKSMNTNGEHV